MPLENSLIVLSVGKVITVYDDIGQRKSQVMDRSIEMSHTFTEYV